MDQDNQPNIHSQQVSLVCWNSRGLVTSLPYLHKLLGSNDIIAISEHWLHANKLNLLTEISPEFNVIARASKHLDGSEYGYKRGQGGVALFWRKTLGGITPMTALKHDRYCGIRFQNESGRVLNILSVYLPAPGSADDFNEVIDTLSENIENMEAGSLTLVCGDFNGDVGHLGGPRSTRKPTSYGKKAFKFLDEFSLCPINLCNITTGPLNTFKGGVGSSTIDYIAVPSCLVQDVVSCEVLVDEILNTSDHYPVQMNMSVMGVKSAYIETDNSMNIKWSKIKGPTLHAEYTVPCEYFCEDLLGYHDIDSMSPSEIDSLINEVTDSLVNLGRKLPKAKRKKHVRPYWNSILTDLKKAKVRAYHIWINEGRPRDTQFVSWVNHKKAKKEFRLELKRVQKDFEQAQLNELIQSAECDRNRFWRLVKNVRQTKQSNTLSIKNRQGKVVHDISEVVEAWRDHFNHLSSKKSDPNYDDAHYNLVTQKVKEWFGESHGVKFIETPFNSEEVKKAVQQLNKGKATGCDAISAEHLQYGGRNLLSLLVKVFNRIADLEYVPTNFRLGTQIPLYKGKNTCTLDQNNYRGITLLTSLNKVFELLLWGRMKDWWEGEQVISPLQGACCAGKSCLHSALTLQETIAVGLDTKKKVLVTYLDVSKAFDGVWIDGLFYQLHQMGLVGKFWRLLYSTYQGFKCKVRIANVYSEWYTMECGIHQGGILSLLKYVAFIDPLLRNLENSGLGSQIADIRTNPVGYADDMASACPSKANIDKSLNIIDKHAKKWHYSYNAKKSAVMVYGETKREFEKGSKYRNFVLNGEKVPEKKEYDHVGVRNCLFQNFMPRTEDRISRGRRAFNAVSSIGIRKKGITMATCSILYWSILVPIVTYGSELWVMSSVEINELRKFQRYIGRRCQRFPKRTPNYSAYTPLGWMSIDRVIQVKKLLFLRTILVMEEQDICKRILKVRANDYANNVEKGRMNENSSPIYEILNTSVQAGMFDICMRMINNGCYLSKLEWKKLVWERVWSMEDDDCTVIYKQPHQKYLLFEIADRPYYLIWWILADLFPRKMQMCEIMAKLVCDSGLLKSTDYRLKGKSFSNKICCKCEMGTLEDIHHLLMQCPFYSNEQTNLHQSLTTLGTNMATRIINEPAFYFHTIMGKQPENAEFQDMIEIWLLTGDHISSLYRKAVKGRK